MQTLRSLVPSRAMAVALLALFVSLSGTAIAASGGTFILGQKNSATDQTTLTRSGGTALQITNNATGPNATPLGLTAGNGRPPIITNSQTKVANLNADLLDGIDSTGFYAAGSTVADSAMLEGHTYAATTADARPQLLLNAFHRGIHQDFAATIHVPAGGRTVLSTLYGSAYSTVVSSAMGLCANATNGTDTVQLSCGVVSANEVNSHKALVSIPEVNDLAAGDWTVSLSPYGTGVTNNDDRYSLVVEVISQ